MHRDGKKEAAREREIHALTLFSSSVPTSSFYLGATKRESGGSLRLDSGEEEGACVPARERERVVRPVGTFYPFLSTFTPF